MGHEQRAAGACVGPEVAAAFASGDLSDEELSRVGVHIDECSRCRRLLSLAAEVEVPASPDASTQLASSLPPPPAPVPGAPLAPGSAVGRYVIDGMLGAGGMGVVYAAHDLELRRMVALKVVRAALLARERRAGELLRREAMAMARLAHPNVVGIYDLFEDAGAVFVAMELVDGTTLRQWLEAEPRPWREVVRVLSLAGRGLAAAHGEGIVHRDFKPDNVLIGRSGRVCVTDFGLSAITEPRPLAQALHAPDRIAGASLPFAGTPRYMSPEQWAGQMATAASDQWSFCVALYEGLYGEHPVPGRPGAAAVVSWKVAPPLQRSPVPAWLRARVLRGLSEVPADRYPTMDALVLDLAADPSVRRRRVVGATLAAVAVGAGLISWAHARQVRQQVCTHAESRFEGAWDAAHRRAASAAFGALGTPFARDQWGAVERALDAYVRRWVAARTQACEAVLARAEPDALDADPQIQCLEDRLEEVRAVALRLPTLRDARDLANAGVAAESLQPVESCATVAAPRRRLSDGATPAARAIRNDLANAAVLSYFGRNDEAADLGVRAVLAAESSGDEVLLARSLLRAGFSHMRAKGGHLEQAEDELRRSILIADATGDDRTRAEAWGDVLFLRSTLKGGLTPVEAQRLFDEGMAAARRFGHDGRVEAILHGALARATLTGAEPGRARGELQAAVVEWERLGDTLNASRMLHNLAIVDVQLGDFESAEREFDRSAEVTRQMLGDSHPDMAATLNDMSFFRVQKLDFEGARQGALAALAIARDGASVDPVTQSSAHETLAAALLGLGRFDEAVGPAAECLAILEKISAPAGRLVAPLADLGRAYLGLGQPAQAVPPLERAIACASAEPEPAADARFALARALDALHGQPDRVRELAAEAQTWLAKVPTLTPLQASKRDEIAAWSSRPRQ